MPATKKKDAMIQALDSNKLAIRKITEPEANTVNNTFRLPNRSLSCPSGICVSKPPTEKAAIMMDSMDTSMLVLKA